LKLFQQVCHAIQHAHHKGVIHRDLKPSNFLVTTQDGRPHAKVIDFGIAKAMHQPLTDMTLFTERALLIGTSAYMSPEQAEGNIDIDTRSDVYSLGVLLYELLTGFTPFDPQRLKKAAMMEVARIIRGNLQLSKQIEWMLPCDSVIDFVAASRDGERFLTTGVDDCTRVWDAKTMEPLLPALPYRASTDEEIEFNYDRTARLSLEGDRILSFVDNKIFFWDSWLSSDVRLVAELLKQ